MTTWDPTDFVWPRLHAAMQVADEDEAEKAHTIWEQAVELYAAYLESVNWPAEIHEFNTVGSLHDGELLDLWHFDDRHKDDRVLITMKLHRGAWDGRDYIAVLKYDGVRSVAISAAPGYSSPVQEGGYWLYDQWAALGDGWYRHYIYFNTRIVAIDFRSFEVTRVFMKM